MTTTTTPPRQRLAYALIGAGIAVALWTQIAPLVGNGYLTDVYSYVLLGRSMLERGAFESIAVRDYFGVHAVPQPSRSFPPLYALLVGIANAVTGAGVAAGVWVNLVALALSLVAAAALGRAIAGDRWQWPFLAVPLYVASNFPYREEAGRGGVLPTTLLLYLVALAVVARSLRTADGLARRAAAIGVLFGMLTLVRFDHLPVTLGMGAVLAIAWVVLHGRVPARRAVLALALAGGIVYAPWAVRNVRLFGSPFASDNSMVAVSTHAGGNLASRFYAPGRSPATVRDQPRLWASQRVTYSLRNTKAAVVGAAWFLVPLALLVIPAWRLLDAPRRALFPLLAVHSAALIATVSLTPYRDPRYVSPIALDAAILLFVVLERLAAAWRPGWTRRLDVGVPAVALAGVAVAAIAAVPRLDDGQFVPRAVVGADGYEAVGPVLRAAGAEAGLTAAPSADRLAYATGLRTINIPRNVRQDNPNFRAWLAAWRPGWIVAPPEWVRGMGLERWRVPTDQSATWWILRVPDSAASAASAPSTGE